MLDLTKQVSEISKKVMETAAERRGQRLLVAIAGAPASGKSTLAGALAKYLNDYGLRSQVVPMDGFHLDNRVLIERNLLERKGAPETFDALGFKNMICRLKAGEEVVVPVFDRALDIAIAGSVEISRDLDIVLIEGNYLLFDEMPWRDLAQLWDISVCISVPMDELRKRLIDRWLNFGLSFEAAALRAESNDIPNAKRVIQSPMRADLELGFN